MQYVFFLDIIIYANIVLFFLKKNRIFAASVILITKNTN